MTTAAVVGEAVRNVLSGTARGAVWGAVVAVLALALGLADALSVADLERRAAEFHARGGATHVLTSLGRVSPGACESLSDVAGVEAAGALRTGEGRLTLGAMPSAPVTVSEVSPGFAGVLDLDRRPGTGLMLSAELADRVLAPGARSVAASDGADLDVAAVFAWPADGRLQALSYAALATVPDGVFDECWVTVWPPNPAAVDLISSAVVPGTRPADVTVGQLNPSMGVSFDGPALFAERDTRWAPVMAAAIGLAVGAGGMRLRRLELASARAVGVGRGALAAQAVVEAVLWAGAALSCSSAVLAVVTVLRAADPLPILSVAGRAPLAAALASVIGAACAAATVDGRHLLRYAKDR